VSGQKDADAISQCTRSLEHEVVVNWAGGIGARSVHIEPESGAGAQRQPVADAGEAHETFKRVVAVRATADNAQRQVDLGGGPLGKLKPAW
jgi:hypothetical protein